MTNQRRQPLGKGFAQPCGGSGEAKPIAKTCAAATGPSPAALPFASLELRQLEEIAHRAARRLGGGPLHQGAGSHDSGSKGGGRSGE
jgi:hypothetical protein